MHNASSVVSAKLNSANLSSVGDKETHTASEWLTAAEAAHYLKIRTRTLLLWVRQGKVQGHALSGSQRHVWRFRHDELDAAFFNPAQQNVLPSFASSVRSAEKEAPQ